MEDSLMAACTPMIDESQRVAVKRWKGDYTLFLLQIVIYMVVEKGMEKKGEQKQALIELWWEHWNYCGWQKDMSRDEAMLNC